MVDGGVGLIIGAAAEMHAGRRDAPLVERQHGFVFANVRVADDRNVGAELELVQRQRQGGKRRIVLARRDLENGEIEFVVVRAIGDRRFEPIEVVRVGGGRHADQDQRPLGRAVGRLDHVAAGIDQAVGRDQKAGAQRRFSAGRDAANEDHALASLSDVEIGGLQRLRAGRQANACQHCGTHDNGSLRHRSLPSESHGLSRPVRRNLYAIIQLCAGA